MRELYNLTASDVIAELADDIVEAHGVSKALARKLVLNALIYNCVQDEVYGQVAYLLGKDPGTLD